MNPIRLSMFTTEERLARRNAAEIRRKVAAENRARLWENGMSLLASIRAEISGKVASLRESAEAIESVGVQKWG